MRLLLKLDAIQGLHPDLRNIRKSLARELVSLQEMLDSIMNQNPEASAIEEPTAKPVKTSTNIKLIPEEKEGLQDNSSADNFDETSNFTWLSQSPVKEGVSVESEGEGILESMPVEEKVEVKSENDTTGAEAKSSVEQHVADMGSVLESKDEQGNGNLDPSQVVSSEPNSDSGHEEIAELALVPENNNNEVGLAEYALGITIHDSNAEDKIEVAEVVDATPPKLPQGIIEEDTAMNFVPELKKDVEIEAEGDTLPEWEKDGKIEAEGNSSQKETQNGNEPEQQPVEQNLEIHELEALPQHVIAEQAKNDEEIEAGEAKVSEGNQAAESDEGTDITARDDEASDMNQLQQEHSMGAVTGLGLQKEGANEEAKEEALEGKLEPQEVKFSTKGSETAKEETRGTENAEGISSNQVVIQETGEEEKPDENEKLIEENKKLREMMEDLINAGKEQLTVISNLIGGVKDLERKLSRKKKLRTRRHRAAAAEPAPASARP